MSSHPHAGAELAQLVVGVDGSTHSAAALRWAADQLSPGGTIHAVHGMGLRDEVAQLGGIPEETSRSEVRATLEHAWLACIADRDVRVEPYVSDDHPVTALLSRADEVAADAVVTGTRSHERWFTHHIGSVPSRLLHRSSRPLVVVPAGYAGPSVSAGRVLAGVDVSVTSDDALAWALARARARAWAVEVVLVVDRNEHAVLVELTGTTWDQLVASAGAYLDSLLATHDTVALDMRHEVVLGDPTVVLLERSLEADLLVLGRRRLGAVDEFFAGSVGRYCVEHASVPVALVASL